MSTTTTNYGLIKPDTTDPILIGQLNDNADAIDAALKENADAIENKPDAADIPAPSTAAPAMDGTATAGTSTDYARADHVHPSDTSKQDALTTFQLAAVNSGIDSAKVAQIATNASDISDIETALGGKVDKETGKGLSTNDYTDAEKTKLAGIAEGAEVNVQSNWTQTTTTADDYIKNKPTLGTAAAKNATDTYNATGADVTTGKAVAEALATLPEPMVFKGSLGTGGTITTLPTASSSNKGYVYKVITAGTYASQSAKVGDTFISDGSAWVLIPSGDEPSGTVTNVAVANGGGLTVSGSPITSSGTITVGHSNSVTAKTSSSLKKFTYDEYGHVTDSSELSTAESDALASGIDSTKVAQIVTNTDNEAEDRAALVELVDSGAKNLIPYSLESLKAINTNGTWVSNVFTANNGVSYTLNSDMTITVNGEATFSAWFTLNANASFGNGTFDLLSGITDRGTDVITAISPTISYGDIIMNSSNYNYYDEQTFSSSQTGLIYAIRVQSGRSFSNVLVKPMLCTKAAWDISQTYQPYRPSYQELYERIVALEQANQ